MLSGTPYDQYQYRLKYRSIQCRPNRNLPSMSWHILIQAKHIIATYQPHETRLKRTWKIKRVQPILLISRRSGTWSARKIKQLRNKMSWSIIYDFYNPTIPSNRIKPITRQKLNYTCIVSRRYQWYRRYGNIDRSIKNRADKRHLSNSKIQFEEQYLPLYISKLSIISIYYLEWYQIEN